MDADLVALRDEIDARLAEVEHTRGTCAGHPALARAIATLLRCQRAQLNQRAANTVAAAKVSGVVGAPSVTESPRRNPHRRFGL